MLIRLFQILIISLLTFVTWFAYQYSHRPGMKEYASHLIRHTAGHGLTVQWLGTAAILLDDGQTRIMIDPYFSRPSFFTMMTHKVKPDAERIHQGLESAGIQSVDAILVSHSHIDHALDAPFIANEMGADIVGSESTANIARGQQVPENQIKVVDPGQPLHYGAFTIRFIPSKHGGWFQQGEQITAPLPSPTFAWNYKMGNVYSILIEHPGGRILHHASAGFIPGNLDSFHAEVVLLGIALRPDTRDYINNVVKAVHAHTVIPIHWDDFTQPLDKKMEPLPAIGMDSFFQDMAKDFPDIRVRTLPPIAPVSIR